MVTWQSGDPLSGTPVTAGDVEFTIEQQDGEEMVVVAEPKAKTVKGELSRLGWWARVCVFAKQGCCELCAVGSLLPMLTTSLFPAPCPSLLPHTRRLPGAPHQAV